MREVYFETDNLIFRFYYNDVVERLPYDESASGTTEASALRDLLLSSDNSIKVPKEQYQFAYLALHLIEHSNGVVYCKACKRYYEAKELKRVVVGHGENPFEVNVRARGWLRTLFGKKQRSPFFGGRGYQCLEGHEVIRLVTWRI